MKISSQWLAILVRGEVRAEAVKRCMIMALAERAESEKREEVPEHAVV